MGTVSGGPVQVRRHFQNGEFPSLHHGEEGPSDQENIVQHPLSRGRGGVPMDKEHHPAGVDKEASRHFLSDAATPPRRDARRGIRHFKMTPLSTLRRKQRLHKVIGREFNEVFHLFSNPNESDRHLQFLGNRGDHTAFGGAVEFR